MRMIFGHLRGRIPSVPGFIRWEVGVAVMQTNRVDLLFVTFDAVWCTDVVTEDPGLAWGLRTRQAVYSTAGEHRSSHNS
jgi:hypothetical protein